jgi:hypothetical protein
VSVRRIDNAPQDQAAKAKSLALVRASGGVEAAAAFCRSNMRRLSEYGRPDNDCFMPIDVVRDLEAVTHGTAGHPIVTRYLAQQAGYTLVRLPSLDAVQVGDLHAACSAHAKEHGEATARVVGLLMARNRDAIDDAIREVDEGIEESVKLRALLVALREQA